MNRVLLLLLLILTLASCTGINKRGTIAQLRGVEIEIVDEELEGGLDKAIASYERFLEESKGTPMGAEAIRRLADLKVEKEYGAIAQNSVPSTGTAGFSAPQTEVQPPSAVSLSESEATQDDAGVDESHEDFEDRASAAEASSAIADTAASGATPENDLERAGALEAVALYQKLLNDYPLYENNDQVLYQLSRAYEELGRVDEAMEVMNRLVAEYPESRYIDEVQFRRAEYYFIRRRYIDAEEAYASIVTMGVGSSFYELALYKLGWTFYKQELYEEGLQRYIALLDHKVSIGYDFDQTSDNIEGQRVQDTLRVISLSFSYLGGADAVVDYFARHGQRAYEDRIYGNLAEYYHSKRRYSDAVATYNAFVDRNPFHRQAPHFTMRIIEINVAGGFPTLVIEAKKAFATNYALDAEYWNYFEPEKRPQVLADLKTNLTDLANHYHALYQNPKFVEHKRDNYQQALHWYRSFLGSFPQDPESPGVNYQLASLLLEDGDFPEAAHEYEKTAYDYPRHEQASQAGYAAVYAYRQQLAKIATAQQEPVKREVIRSSIKFSETFPEHEKAALVLAAAAEDLYGLKDFAPALAAARDLIERFPTAEKDILRSGWLIAAHSSYELELFSDAEVAYAEVLTLLEPDDPSRTALIDNLAASIYKQGEVANQAEDYQTAAEHFLRIATVTPTSTIRPAAEFDGATALIQLKDWERSAEVLTRFRSDFPGHALQPEVTKKLAFIYREDEKFILAAQEYERIERESQDQDVRREALLIAAELYEKMEELDQTLRVYRRYVDNFPFPVEFNLETRDRIATILKKQQREADYLAELKLIIALDAGAGEQRTDRTRYLAGKAALVFAEIHFNEFAEVELVIPFEENLRKKQALMKVATQDFAKLYDYQTGEVTAAATYYLAEIYANFSASLVESERPEGLSDLELEEYELMIEDQAYPFEEKAIATHESNLALLDRGIYNDWIEKSLARLAKFIPARYAKPEEQATPVADLELFSFENEALAVILPSAEQAAADLETALDEKSDEAVGTDDVSQEDVAIDPESGAVESPEDIVPADENPATDTAPADVVDSGNAADSTDTVSAQGDESTETPSEAVSEETAAAAAAEELAPENASEDLVDEHVEPDDVMVEAAKSQSDAETQEPGAVSEEDAGPRSDDMPQETLDSESSQEPAAETATDDVAVHGEQDVVGPDTVSSETGAETEEPAVDNAGENEALNDTASDVVSDEPVEAPGSEKDEPAAISVAKPETATDESNVVEADESVAADEEQVLDEPDEERDEVSGTLEPVVEDLEGPQEESGANTQVTPASEETTEPVESPENPQAGEEQ